MKTVDMRIWVAQPKLEPGETIRWTTSAGRALNRWLTSGGHLVVTDRRLLFQPNRFDIATGKRRWELSLSDVAGVESVEREPAVAAGGSRRRLGIRSAAGLEIFVVNRLQEKITRL